MFFSAYFGHEPGVEGWLQAMEEHARWLGLGHSCYEESLGGDRFFHYGWVHARNFSPPAYPADKSSRDLTIATAGAIKCAGELPGSSPDRVCLSAPARQTSNEVVLELSGDKRTLHLYVPPASPEQFFYYRSVDGYLLSNDLRFLLRAGGLELDERAVYALLQYGAIPAPFSISKSVRRIPGGYVFSLSSPGEEPRQALALRFSECRPPISPDATAGVRVKEALKTILSEVPEAPILFFSGGVDSTLLAYVFQELGRTDAQLVNFGFGSGDAEARLALEAAGRLGFRCHQLVFDPAKLVSMLQSLGQIYSVPFGDYATMATYQMVAGVREMGLRMDTAVNGIGADGAFGLGKKYPSWQTLYRIPAAVRRPLSEGYRWLEMWKYGSILERPGRFARRSLQMPLKQAAVIAQNSFDGIAYQIPPDVRQELQDTVETYLGGASAGLEPPEQMSILDLMHVCAGQFAAKSFDPLRREGIRAIFPFLSPLMVTVSASLTWEEKYDGRETKRLLKEILAETLPHEMVYRSKSAFIPPIKSILARSDIQAFIHDVVLAPNSLLRPFFERNVVRSMVRRARGSHELSYGTYNFLWMLIFATAWLEQQACYLNRR